MITILHKMNSLCCSFCVLLLLNSCSLFGQKQDYIWLSGYESGAGIDSFTGKMFGTTVLDFNSSNRTIRFDTLKMNFDFTNVSYCDSDGNLLFYSNGVHIRNSLDEKIENSDTMNAGYLMFEVYPGMLRDGYRLAQGIIVLEDPANRNNYYLIHSYIDTFLDQSLIFCKRINYTYLDMNANLGHGKAQVKDQTILDSLYGYELKATRHANGRDWWILVQRRNTNCYERILLDITGLHVLSPTCGGHGMGGLSGSACFSPDGSKYVYVSLQQGISLFDFDRCTGELSNPLYKPLRIFADSGLIGIGTAFSPNNRFLYVNATIHCYQFDLWANDVWSSIDTVARYDGAYNPFASVFHTMQIAPDGKIYSGCGNGEFVYHVIERPDEKGDSCLFRQHGVDLPSYAGYCLPNFPNYRLGALTGSGCDTLTDIELLQKGEILVYPNPATEFIIIDYGIINWNSGKAELQISNSLGQITYERTLPMFSGFQKIELTQFAVGAYVVTVTQNKQTIFSTKFNKI